MNIFLTGISGFSGNHVALNLLKQGHYITALTRQEKIPYTFDKYLSTNQLSIIHADLNNLQFIPKYIEVIIHMAATSPSLHVSHEQIFMDNINATMNLIRLSKQLNLINFIFFSSLSLYGSITDSVVNENTAYEKPDFYGASKLFCEMYLRYHLHVPSLSIRLPAIIGYGAKRHWLSKILHKAKNNFPIDIFNPDALFNNAIHVDDLSILISTAISTQLDEHHAITIGSSGTISILALVTMVKDFFQSQSEVIIQNGFKKSFLISTQKVCKLYNFVPKHIANSVSKYLKETIEEA